MFKPSLYVPRRSPGHAMKKNDTNSWSLSGVIKEGTEPVVTEYKPGNFATAMILVNHQTTEDGKGKTLDYPVSILGDHRQVLSGLGEGLRVRVYGYLKTSDHGTFCQGTGLEIEGRESFDLNQFEVSGLVGVFPRVVETERGPMTEFSLHICRYSHTGKQTSTGVTVSVFRDCMAQVKAMSVYKGTRVIIRGRLAVGRYRPWPLGWMFKVDTASQAWRPQNDPTRYMYKR